MNDDDMRIILAGEADKAGLGNGARPMTIRELDIFDRLTIAALASMQRAYQLGRAEQEALSLRPQN